MGDTIHDKFDFFTCDELIDISQSELEKMWVSHKHKDEKCRRGTQGKRQCQFINRIGMRCTEMVETNKQTCERHMCTYETLDRKRCQNVSDCRTKGYCKKHGGICRCRYIMESGVMCSKTIYYGYFKNGITYCGEHACVYGGCRNAIHQNNSLKLCSEHYSALPICMYVNKYGKKCGEYIDDPRCESEMSITCSCNITDVPCNISVAQHNYCVSHHCRIRGCFNMIMNDTTQYCAEHVERCGYIHPNGKRCEEMVPKEILTTNIMRYTNYITKQESIMMCHTIKDKSDKRVLCNEHRCKWIDGSEDGMERCNRQIEEHEDCSQYCFEHYKTYRFREYEYE